MSAPQLFPDTPVGDFARRVEVFANFRGCSPAAAEIVLSAHGDVYEVSVRRLTDKCVQEIYEHLAQKGSS